MTAPAIRRRIASSLASLGCALVAALASACSQVTVSDPNPHPSESLTPSAEASTTPAAAPSSTSKPPTLTAPATFPSTAKAYAEAVLAAWKAKQLGRLGELTTPLVQDQIISIPGPPNQDWGYNRCDGAAGSSYCVFTNNDGDVITLRVLNSLLGKARATTEVKLDQTEYPTDAKAYVENFVEAWRNANTKRMLALSSQSVTEYFTHFVPPSTYTVCSKYTAPTWRVRIYNSDGVNYRVFIDNAARGKAHAITNPGIQPLPPECS